MNNIPKKNNVELDITPELAIMAAQTLKEYCENYPLSCVKDNRSCPFLKNGKVCSFEHIINPCELSLPEIK